MNGGNRHAVLQQGALFTAPYSASIKPVAFAVGVLAAVQTYALQLPLALHTRATRASAIPPPKPWQTPPRVLHFVSNMHSNCPPAFLYWPAPNVVVVPTSTTCLPRVCYVSTIHPLPGHARDGGPAAPWSRYPSREHSSRRHPYPSPRLNPSHRDASPDPYA